MRILILLCFLALAVSCRSGGSSHTVSVIKPKYHHTWYKNSKWHKKLQVGRIRVRWFEKQGTKTVRMKS